MNYDETDPHLRVDLYDKVYAALLVARQDDHEDSWGIFTRTLALALRTCDKEARMDERSRAREEEKTHPVVMRKLVQKNPSRFPGDGAFDEDY